MNDNQKMDKKKFITGTVLLITIITGYVVWTHSKKKQCSDEKKQCSDEKNSEEKKQ